MSHLIFINNLSLLINRLRSHRNTNITNTLLELFTFFLSTLFLHTFFGLSFSENAYMTVMSQFIWENTWTLSILSDRKSISSSFVRHVNILLKTVKKKLMRFCSYNRRYPSNCFPYSWFLHDILFCCYFQDVATSFYSKSLAHN